MLSKTLIVLFACAAGYLAMPQNASPNDQSFQFAMDTDLFLSSPLDLSFSCDGRQYGYYADVSNNCQVFHICLPIEDDFGAVVETAHWSFICGNATVFDQQTLTCNYPQDSIPCDQSESLYNSVEYGKIPDY